MEENLVDLTTTPSTSAEDTESVSGICEVIGIVYPPGAGGGQARGETDWSLNFVFQPWRLKDGPVLSTPLHVHSRVSKDELSVHMELLKPYGIWRARLQMAEGASDRAALIKLIGPVISDDEMTQLSKELQKPVTVEDNYFGSFTFDRSVNWLETQALWQSKQATLQLSLDGCDDQAALMRSAQAFWEAQESWDRRVRECAVSELLDLKNDSWLEDEEDAVSEDDFNRRITVESITLYPDGEFEVLFRDGDLFWGHAIIVSGTLEDGPEDATIAG